MGTSPGPPRPHGPWLLLPLLLVAGTTKATPQSVIGVLGGSVLLSLILPHNETVKKIEWSFSKRVCLEVAEFGPNGFIRPNPEDRFKDRLEINQTALKIERLELGDSGVYEARIKLVPAVVVDQLFTLSVYGPLQEPEIQPQLLSLSTHGCNLTLRCRVPAGSGAEATWEPMAPWGHPCEDNQALCLAVPPSAFNSTFTCVARNPIETRNVSISLDTLCQQEDGWRRWHWCLVAVGVAVGALLGGVWLWRKKTRRRRRKKRAEGAALASIQDAPSDPPYAEIQRGPPQEERLGGEDTITIYSQVQAKAGRGGGALA